MVRPFGTKYAKLDQHTTAWTIQNAYKHLEDAHTFLVEHAHPVLGSAARVAPDGQWGTNVKRIPISFPRTDLRLLENDHIEHNFVEVINMCATIERMLDALLWAQQTGFSEHLVWICHPTASSNAEARLQGEPDNDLVLISRNNDGMAAHFEVSDVSGNRDGNDKERKDLESLKVLLEGEKGPNALNKDWPNAHMFLVVAAKFGHSICERTRRMWRIGNPPHCTYHPHDTQSNGESKTLIVEIVDGKIGRSDIKCSFKCCRANNDDADQVCQPS